MTQPTMQPETLTALQGSIKKWEAIVNGDDSDRYSSNCPLCQRFGVHCVTDDDEQCPVYVAAGSAHCNDTPYMEWDRECDLDEVDGRMASTPARKLAAEAELAFLRSLLPGAER